MTQQPFNASPPDLIDTLSTEPSRDVALPAPQPASIIRIPIDSERSRWWQRISIKTKATVLAVTLGVVPVLAVGGVAIYVANKILTEQAYADRQRLTISTSIQLSDFIRNRLSDAETIATNPLIINSANRQAISSKAVVNYFDSFVERDSTYGLISAITPDGAYAHLGDGTPLRTSEADVPTELDKPDVKPFVDRQVPYFLQVRDTLRPAVIANRQATANGKSSFYVAVPALNAAEQLAYVIYSQTEIDNVAEVVRSNLINLLRKGDGDASRRLPEFSVVSNDTAYFAKSVDGKEQEMEVAPKRIEVQNGITRIDGKPLPSDKTIATKENRIFLGSEQASLGTEMQSIFPSYVQLRDGGAPTTISDVSQRDKQSYLLSYAPIPQVEGVSLDWGVLIYEPTATALAPQRTLIVLLSLGTLISALLVGTIAAYIANRGIRPLLDATDAVNRIGEGDLNTRIEVRGYDEIALLGTNINSMATQIQTFLDAQTLEAERQRLLAEAKGSGALRITDFEMIFDRVIEDLHRLLRVDRIILYRLHSNWSGAVISEASNTPAEEIGADIEALDIPESLLYQYSAGTVVPLDNVATADLPIDYRQQMSRLNVAATLTAPIFNGDRLFGLLIAHRAVPYIWQESEMSLFQQVATELGLSLFRATLLEETERLAEEQRELKEGLQQRALELLLEVDPIGKGDLTVEAKVTPDEIGTIADSYNTTVENLRKIVRQVQATAAQVTSTAGDNQESVRSLSQEASRQAEEIIVTLQRIEDMANAAQAVATNAEQANVAVQQATLTVMEGDAAMNRTVQGIQTIRATVAETAKKVKRLGESSQKISTVVDLIGAFAEQTRMLSLNASIEAALAGEQGRGFAVVADEVRTLARRSTEATEEIRKLVAGIQAETNDVVMAMESGTEQVVMGTKLVDETRQSLTKITVASAQISQLVEAIAAATVVQSQASETVTQTMQEMATIASKTSTEANSVSASFEQLREVAQALQASVAQFKV